MDQEARGLQIRPVSFSPGRTANQAIYALACDDHSSFIMCNIVARGGNPSVTQFDEAGLDDTGSFGPIPKLTEYVII